MIFNQDEPLGLPKGSVRAILAIELVTFCLAYFWRFNEFPTTVVTLLFMVVTCYFAVRGTTGAVVPGAQPTDDMQVKKPNTVK